MAMISGGLRGLIPLIRTWRMTPPRRLSPTVCAFHLRFGLVEGGGQPRASMYEAFRNPMPRCACEAGLAPHHQLTAEFRGHLNWMTRDPAECPKCSTTRRARPAIRIPVPWQEGKMPVSPMGRGTFSSPAALE